jgi:hypothetical protein
VSVQEKKKPTMIGDWPEKKARNDRIRSLAKEENTYGEIVAMLKSDYPGLTRECVAGVIKSAGDSEAKATGIPKPIRKPGRRASATVPKRTPPPQAKSSFGKISFGKISTQAPPRPKAPPRPPSEVIAQYEREAPPGAVGLFERTGCCWPFGDPREGLRYCNALRCKVRTPGGSVVATKYCSDHWGARRTTKNTKVLA